MNKSGIRSESYLSDNEREIVFTFKYIDYKGKEGQMAIYAANSVEAVKLFKKFEGPKAQIMRISRQTYKEAKEERL